MEKLASILAPNKILIIRLSSIGDVLLTTPIIRLLKSKFPACQIDFVIKNQFAELLKFHPGIHHLYCYNKNEKANSLIKIKQQIRNKRYDLILDLHKNFRSYFLIIGSQARKIIRYQKGVLQRWLLVKFKINLYQTIAPIYQRYINCLKGFAIKYDGKGLEIFFDQPIAEKVHEKYSAWLNHPAGLTIGIAPGAKHATKCWTAEGFSSVINYFISTKNARIILLGSDGDREIIQSLSIERPQMVLNTVGELSLLEASAMMSHCNLVLTNDSGLMHLATAMKKKVVAIFGSTTEELGFFPYLTEYRVVQNNNLKCRPCSHVGRKKCPKGHFKCMKEITAEQVIHAIDELLGKTNPR